MPLYVSSKVNMSGDKEISHVLEQMVGKVEEDFTKEKSETQLSVLTKAKKPKSAKVRGENYAEYLGYIMQTKLSKAFGFSYDKRSSKPVPEDFGNCASESHIRHAQDLGRFLKIMGDDIYNRYAEQQENELLS